MKIGLTGSHGTGKTSVAREFAKSAAYKLVTSVSRTVADLGYEINERATRESQALTSMARVADQLTAGDNFVTDRTVLDSMAYNAYQLENVWPKDAKTDFWYNTMDTLSRNLMGEYDYLVYVPITFKLVGDGVRAEDAAYQQWIDRAVLRFLGEYQLPFYVLPDGTVEQRVEWLADLTGVTRWDKL